MKKITTLLLFLFVMLASTSTATNAPQAPVDTEGASAVTQAEETAKASPATIAEALDEADKEYLVMSGKQITVIAPGNFQDEQMEDLLSGASKDKEDDKDKKKQKSDPMKLVLAFFINFMAIMIVVRCLYYPKCRRGEFFFTYILIAISTFLLIYVLGDVSLKTGIAMGLFAMFSIIRYRTEQIAIREMTYLFIIIALSSINGLTIGELSTKVVVIINVLFILSTWLCESKLFVSHYSYKVIKYDNINLITPEKRDELIADLEKRTGLNIVKVEVGAIDFLKDAAIVKMYYKSNEANNSVDTTLKTPTDEYKLK